MAYEKKTWVCGEIITDAGLNNIENGIEEALECCDDKEFECVEEITVLTEETVATYGGQGMPFSMGAFVYSALIDAEKIRVTLDGETYWADRTYVESPEKALVGANICFVFTEWPEIKGVTPAQYKELMRTPLVYDGRNLYTLQEMKDAGIEYYSIGR